MSKHEPTTTLEGATVTLKASIKELKDILEPALARMEALSGKIIVLGIVAGGLTGGAVAYAVVVYLLKG